MDIDLLLLACITGTASADEYSKAWGWVQEDPGHLKYYLELRDAWLSSGLNRAVPVEQVNNSFKNVKAKVEGLKSSAKVKRQKFLLSFSKIAAILLVAFLFGITVSAIYFINKTKSVNYGYFVVEAPRGAKSVLTMADGTKIWLNAGSQIKYDYGFNLQNRNIYLRGEAYFDVAKNRKLPFLVHSGDVIVRAVGTKFNVKAYPEDGTIETTLVEGLVSIEKVGKSRKKDTIILQPRQKALYSEGSTEKKKKVDEIEKEQSLDKVEIKKEVDTQVYTSWKDKRWIFRKENLKDFAIKLERLYDVKIIFQDQGLEEFKLTGTIEEESIEQVLNAIKLTIPVEYEINHRLVTLRSDERLTDKYTKILKHK